MDKRVNGVKCAQCGLVNFATDESCKRCDTTLAERENASASLKPQIFGVERKYIGVAAAIVIVAAIGIAAIFLLLVSVTRLVAKQRATQSDIAAAERVANSNHDAARSAVNAIEEVQSVISVGTNFMQYTAANQSAKIKFDAAMRNYESRSAGDQE